MRNQIGHLHDDERTGREGVLRQRTSPYVFRSRLFLCVSLRADALPMRGTCIGRSEAGKLNLLDALRLNVSS